MTLPPFMTTSRTAALLPNSQFNFEELERSALKTLAGLEQGLSATETLASIDNVVLMSGFPEAVATGIVDVSTKDFPMMLGAPKAVTPLPSPTCSEAMTAKKVPTARESHAKSKTASKPNMASLLPTKNDPMDPSFLVSLHSHEDKGKINIAHVAIRRYVLDVRRTVSGRVYLQCSFCKHLPRDKRANCSTVSPKRIEGLYRSVIRFMNHVNACDHIPHEIKAMSPKSFTKHAKDGIKSYWIESAYALGLANGDDGIMFCPEATY